MNRHKILTEVSNVANQRILQLEEKGIDQKPAKINSFICHDYKRLCINIERIEGIIGVLHLVWICADFLVNEGPKSARLWHSKLTSRRSISLWISQRLPQFCSSQLNCTLKKNQTYIYHLKNSTIIIVTTKYFLLNFDKIYQKYYHSSYLFHIEVLQVFYISGPKPMPNYGQGKIYPLHSSPRISPAAAAAAAHPAARDDAGVQRMVEPALCAQPPTL